MKDIYSFYELGFDNIIPISGEHNLGITDLLDEITKDFESYDKFKKQFEAAATQVEASGWCILVWVPKWNKLEILQCEKHQDLTLWGCKPLLVLDMWEHSYFLQYKTNRPEYIKAFWNIVNWNVINRRWNK